MIFTDESGTPKRLASTLIIAAFAFPLTGGSFTQISKLVSLNFFTLSSLEFGFTLTKIFIVWLNYISYPQQTFQIPSQINRFRKPINDICY